MALRDALMGKADARIDRSFPYEERRHRPFSSWEVNITWYNKPQWRAIEAIKWATRSSIHAARYRKSVQNDLIIQTSRAMRYGVSRRRLVNGAVAWRTWYRGWPPWRTAVAAWAGELQHGLRGGPR